MGGRWDTTYLYLQLSDLPSWERAFLQRLFFAVLRCLPSPRTAWVSPGCGRYSLEKRTDICLFPSWTAISPASASGGCCTLRLWELFMAHLRLGSLSQGQLRMRTPCLRWWDRSLHQSTGCRTRRWRQMLPWHLSQRPACPPSISRRHPRRTHVCLHISILSTNTDSWESIITPACHQFWVYFHVLLTVLPVLWLLFCLLLGASKSSPPQQFDISINRHSPSPSWVLFISFNRHVALSAMALIVIHTMLFICFGFELSLFWDFSVCAWECFVLEFHKTFMCIFPLFSSHL